MLEFNFATVVNYEELAALMASRPFMVERGHSEGVATDEWVAHEFAKVRRFYNQIGLGDNAEIEFLDGPHDIHDGGTFRFLREHLDWQVRIVGLMSLCARGSDTRWPQGSRNGHEKSPKPKVESFE